MPLTLKIGQLASQETNARGSSSPFDNRETRAIVKGISLFNPSFNSSIFGLEDPFSTSTNDDKDIEMKDADGSSPEDLAPAKKRERVRPTYASDEELYTPTRKPLKRRSTIAPGNLHRPLFGSGGNHMTTPPTNHFSEQFGPPLYPRGNAVYETPPNPQIGPSRLGSASVSQSSGKRNRSDEGFQHSNSQKKPKHS